MNPKSQSCLFQEEQMKPKSKWEEMERKAYIEGDVVLAQIYADAMDIEEELADEVEEVRRLKQEVDMWRTRNEY
jgi:hypothetical protein